MKNIWIKGFTVTALAATVAACGGSGSSSEGSSTGTASFDLTDAAVDSVKAVNITVVGVELQPANGEKISFDLENPENLEDINLLDLQNGSVESLLSDQELPAGEYQWIRLKLGDQSTFSVIDDNDGANSLKVPSGNSRGLQTSGFVVPAGGTVDFTIDFDVRKSLINPPGLDGYLLKPVLRLVDNTEVGTIAGAVDPTLLASACSDAGTTDTSVYAGAVYIHTGHDVAPDDLGSSNEPLVAVPVDTTTFEYQASFIPAGDYTVSYTCDMDEREDDNGEPLDEDLAFVPADGIEITVEAGKTSEVAIN